MIRNFNQRELYKRGHIEDDKKFLKRYLYKRGHVEDNKEG